MSEEKCWWWLHSGKIYPCVMDDYDKFYDCEKCFKQCIVPPLNHLDAKPYYTKEFSQMLVGGKNYCKDCDPRSHYYGTRKHAELLAEWSKNYCESDRRLCNKKATMLVIIPQMTKKYHHWCGECGKLHPENNLKKIPYPPHWLEEEKPKRADETSAPISHRPPPKWFVGPRGDLLRALKGISKYHKCQRCKGVTYAVGEGNGAVQYCPQCCPDFYSWDDDDMPGKNDEVDTGKHHSVDAEPAAPAPLTQDPKHFRGHIEGCHWSGYSNYNSCSCYIPMNESLDLKTNGTVNEHHARHVSTHDLTRIVSINYSDWYWSEYD